MTLRRPRLLRQIGIRAAAVISAVWKRFFRRWVLALAGMFPLTRPGLAFLALFSAAIYFYGLLARDLVLLVVGLGGALILISLLLCTIVASAIVWTRSRRARTPGELDLDTGMPQPTGYRLRMPRWIPFVVIEWQWVDDGGGETAAAVELERQQGESIELASPKRRCIVTRIVRRFSVRDLFGLTELSWRRREEVFLRVLPYRGMLTEMPPPAGMADGDDLSDPYAQPHGDRVEMRQYAAGDPLRMVLWKVYARTGRMMVRTPERSVAERKRGCAYLVTSPEDDATAAAARVAIERGLLGEDWSFAADGVDMEAGDRDSAFEIIARSGEASAEQRAARLAAFLGQRENEGYQFCLLFIPPDEAAWEAVARQAAATTMMHVQILTAVTRLLPDEENSGRWTQRAARWLMKPRQTDGASLAEIRRRSAQVRGIASELIVADRASGHTVNDMLVHGS